MDGARPLGSCSSGIRCCTFAGASVVESMLSSVSSISESKALAACEDGTLAPGYCLAAGKSVRVDGCRALGLGCSRRRVTVPWIGGVRMRSPCRKM